MLKNSEDFCRIFVNNSDNILNFINRTCIDGTIAPEILCMNYIIPSVEGYKSTNIGNIPIYLNSLSNHLIEHIINHDYDYDNQDNNNDN